jgi:hypothetical protein
MEVSGHLHAPAAGITNTRSISEKHEVKISLGRPRSRSDNNIKTETGSGVHPASYSVATGSFPGVKQRRREANHSPQSSAQVKNVWS